MSTVQLGISVAPGYVDPRRQPGSAEDFESRVETNRVLATANATGTTTTLVSANANLPNDTDVIRVGDKFKLYDSNDVLLEPTVFTVDSIAVGVSTTATFSPAAAVAPVSGDYAKEVGFDNQSSVADLDTRLLAAGFSQDYVNKQTLNDKLYQVRVLDDPGSL